MLIRNLINKWKWGNQLVAGGLVVYYYCSRSTHGRNYWNRINIWSISNFDFEWWPSISQTKLLTVKLDNSRHIVWLQSRWINLRHVDQKQYIQFNKFPFGKIDFKIKIEILRKNCLFSKHYAMSRNVFMIILNGRYFTCRQTYRGIAHLLEVEQVYAWVTPIERKQWKFHFVFFFSFCRCCWFCCKVAINWHVSFYRPSYIPKPTLNYCICT